MKLEKKAIFLLGIFAAISSFAKERNLDFQPKFDRKRIQFLGGRDSGGGDIASLRARSAWFMTAEKVKSCIKVHPQFALDGKRGDETLRDLSKAISKAGEIWANYTSSRLKVYSSFVSSQTGSNFSFPTGVEILKSCDGSEEVTYYFGTQSDALKERAKSFDTPIAFVGIPTFNPDTGRSEGEIFVAGWADLTAQGLPEFSLWQMRSWTDLVPLILHEMGHYHGIAYVPGTVMRQEVQALLSLPPSKRFLIDHEVSLAPPHLSTSIPGDSDSFSTPIGFDGSLEKHLTGKNSGAYGGNAKLELTLHPFREMSVAGKKEVVQLSIMKATDPSGESLDMSGYFEQPQDVVKIATGVFSIYKGGRTFSLAVESFTQSGYFISENGVRVPIRLAYNAGYLGNADLQDVEFSYSQTTELNSLPGHEKGHTGVTSKRADGSWGSIGVLQVPYRIYLDDGGDYQGTTIFQSVWKDDETEPSSYLTPGVFTLENEEEAEGKLNFSGKCSGNGRNFRFGFDQGEWFILDENSDDEGFNNVFPPYVYQNGLLELDVQSSSAGLQIFRIHYDRQGQLKGFIYIQDLVDPTALDCVIHKNL